jgi:hypothetical protein
VAPFAKALPVLAVVLLVVGVLFYRRRQLYELRRRHKSSWRDSLRVVTIAVSFAQINASFPSIMNDFPWPIEYVAFLKQWAFIEFDLVDLLRLKCVGGNWDYRTRIVLVVMIPVASVLIVGIFYCMRHHALARGRRRSNVDDADQQTRMQRAFEHLFDIVDVDCSGTIEPFELRVLLQTLGNKSATLSEARDLLQQMGGVRVEVAVGNGAHSMRVLMIPKKRFVRAATSGNFPAGQIRPWIAYSESVRLKSSCMSILLMSLFVLHAPVSAKLCRFYACTPVAGRMFLQDDFSIECWEGDFLAFSPFVVVSLSVFTFGFPLSLVWILYRHRKNFHKPRVYARYGFLYAPFREGCEFWELHELTRKLMLTGLLVFLPPVARAAASIAICVGTVAVLNYSRPHRNHSVFVAEQASFLLTTLKYVAAVLLVARDATFAYSGRTAVQGEREVENRVISAMLIALDLIFVTGTFAVLLFTIVLCRRKQQSEGGECDLPAEQLDDEPRRSPSRTRSGKLRHKQHAANVRIDAASTFMQNSRKARSGRPAHVHALTPSVVKAAVTATRLRKQTSRHFQTRSVYQERVRLNRLKARARLAARLRLKNSG